MLTLFKASQVMCSVVYFCCSTTNSAISYNYSIAAILLWHGLSFINCAILTNKAVLIIAFVVVPRVSPVWPDVDTVLLTAAVVWLSSIPYLIVHEGSTPSIIRIRLKWPHDLQYRSDKIPRADKIISRIVFHISSRPQEDSVSVSVATRKFLT